MPVANPVGKEPAVAPAVVKTWTPEALVGAAALPTRMRLPEMGARAVTAPLVETEKVESMVPVASAFMRKRRVLTLEVAPLGWWV